MPIYEFLCAACNTIYSFHSFRVNTEKVPSCPKCDASGLQRVPSSFGVGTGAADEPPAGPDLDDPQVEEQMMRLASEMESLDERDPRAMAGAVRRMAEIAGERVTPAMEEMIRRLEAGEDPEKIEEDLGDALEEEMGAESGGRSSGRSAPPARDQRIYPL